MQQRLAIAETPSIEALRWAQGLPQTANEVLALDLRQIIDTPAMLRLEPIRYLHPEGTELRTVLLPCEHEMRISEHAVFTLSERECLDVQCPRCDTAILPNRDVVEYYCSLERRRQ